MSYHDKTKKIIQMSLRISIFSLAIFGIMYVSLREIAIFLGEGNTQAVIVWRGDVRHYKHSVDTYRYMFLVDGKKYFGDMYYDEKYSIGDTIPIKYVESKPDWNRFQKED